MDGFIQLAGICLIIYARNVLIYLGQYYVGYLKWENSRKAIERDAQNDRLWRSIERARSVRQGCSRKFCD